MMMMMMMMMLLHATTGQVQVTTTVEKVRILSPLCSERPTSLVFFFLSGTTTVECSVALERKRTRKVSHAHGGRSILVSQSLPWFRLFFFSSYCYESSLKFFSAWKAAPGGRYVFDLFQGGFPSSRRRFGSPP